MEWQAGYASGAFLMPITPLQRLARDVLGKTRLTQVVSTSREGQELLRQVQSQFQVSAEAAIVRLRQRRYFSDSEHTLPLFS
jgi:Zn-dependent peptidase ImmA (M78 family)